MDKLKEIKEKIEALMSQKEKLEKEKEKIEKKMRQERLEWLKKRHPNVSLSNIVFEKGVLKSSCCYESLGNPLAELLIMEVEKGLRFQFTSDKDRIDNREAWFIVGKDEAQLIADWFYYCSEYTYEKEDK